MTEQNVAAITEEPNSFGCSKRRMTATGEAVGHVRRAKLTRQSWTSGASAASAGGDQTDAVVYRRIVSRVAEVRFRPGDLGEHVGLPAEQLDASIGRLIVRGLLMPQSKAERCDVLTEALISAADK